MSNEYEQHRCVTEFMLDTCQYAPQSDEFHVCLTRAFTRAFHNVEIETFISGSSVEFYIKPLLSCIGDVDIMFWHNGVIVIPAGQTPPAELPDHYQSAVTVVEIIDSHQPGYVYLRHSYTLKKSDNGRYVVQNKEYTRNVPRYFSIVYPPHEIISVALLGPQYFHRDSANIMHKLLSPEEIHGPALTRINKVPRVPNVDSVPCIHCLAWPLQAVDWPTRSRKHNWPDSATISTVVINGCDVVHAVHPSCKQDEWMSKYQWRLSFSRAEVTLLNSWTPVQQIIYHMLRFVMKREILTEEYKKPNLPRLSNYHIKTLMMWECEQKPQSWWSAEYSLIKLCSSLLYKLSDCAAVKCCQQYFISNCNLLDHFVDDDDDASLMLCNRLNSLSDVPVLLSWFVKHYLLHSAKKLVPFLDICSSNITTQVRIVADYQVKKIQHDLCWNRQVTEVSTLSCLHVWRRIDNAWTQAHMEELQRYNAHARDYFVAVTSLHVAYNISIHSLTEELLEILWTLINPCTTCIGNVVTNVGRLSISKAIQLARLNNADSDALWMLHNEMSKAYLHHSFAYGLESTYCVVHVLLAALYYKSGHYQAAVDHCKQVLNEKTCKQCGVRSIGAEYLPRIDENVDAVIGLILFYEHVQINTMQSVDHSVSNKADLPAFTTKLLARYLHSKCSTVVDAKVTVYRQHLFHTERLLLSDLLLFKTVDTQLNKCTRTRVVEIRAHNAENTASSSMDISPLVTTLELVALEKLITYRQVMVRELHCEQFPVMNEFEALYAYKCGLFEECLQTCRSYLNMTLHRDCWKHQIVSLSFPEMLTLLDGDLVSVFGIVRLICPLHLFSAYLQHPYLVDFSMRTLSLYLMVECHKKLSIDMRDTLQLIRFVHNATDEAFVLDRFVLKVIYRSLYMCIYS